MANTQMRSAVRISLLFVLVLLGSPWGSGPLSRPRARSPKTCVWSHGVITPATCGVDPP